MKYKKLLGAGKDIGAGDLAIRAFFVTTTGWPPLVPAVDKKRNPTGYSESDDEDVPF